jgi:hypothetical protein
MITVEGVTRKYRNFTAVHDVSLTVRLLRRSRSGRSSETFGVGVSC